jgi:hypothetical protein
MTRRAKIVVGVVMLSAVVLAGSAIAQATSSHTTKEQRVKAAHPASALHGQVRAVKSAKVKESRSGATHARAQTAPQNSQAEAEKPETVGTEAVDDNSPEANDDDPAIENEQADDDDQGEQSDDEQGEREDDDDQGEQEDTSAGDQDDDSSAADVEDDDVSSDQAEEDGHEDEDAGDD